LRRALDTAVTATPGELAVEPVPLAAALAEENATLRGWDDGDGPHVFTNMVSTLDGAATLAGRSGGLGGEGDRTMFRAIRALADVIVVGAATARTERYHSAVPSEAVQEWRVGNGLAPVPTVAIVTASGRLGGVPMLEDPHPSAPRSLIYCGAGGDDPSLHDVQDAAEVVRSDTQLVDPPGVVFDLAARGHRRILTEGGPALLAQFHAADLVDEWFVTIAPIVSAGEAPRLMSAHQEQPRDLELVHAWVHEGALFLRHRRPDQRSSSGGMTST
jgi:riboflavin biosynthesis pyrimidine reductase